MKGNASVRKKKMISEFTLGIHSKQHVKNFIKIVKPMKWKYHWNIKYENYLKKLCEEEGYKINSSIIKKAIDDAFEYKRPIS